MNKFLLVIPLLVIQISFVYGQTIGLNRDVTVFESNFTSSGIQNLDMSEYVSKQNGAAGYNIPVYNLEVDKISLPISINYGSNGFRPGGVQSVAGLHWELLAGGEITRSVKGIPDENGYLYYSTIKDSLMNLLMTTNSLAIQKKLDSVNKIGMYDVSQDDYTVKLFNFSDKVFINSEKQFEFSRLSDFKIFHSRTGSTMNFWIIDPTGNRYDFDERVTTTTKSKNGYSTDSTTTSSVTSWKLKRITTHLGKVINFEYTSNIYTYSIPTNDTYISQSFYYYPDYKNTTPGGGTDTSETNPVEPPLDCNCSTAGYIIHGNLTATVNDRVISRIVSDGAVIQFLYEDDSVVTTFRKRLSTINVFGPDRLLKFKYTLQHGYYPGNNRLKLLSYRQVDRLDENKFIEYKFLYHEQYPLPVFNTRGLDIYGFYNGADANTQLIYTSDTLLNYARPNRLPNEEYAKQSLLKEVILPTGGRIIWNYESNTTSGGLAVAGGLRTQSVEIRGLSDSLLLNTRYVYRNMHTNGVLVENGVVPDHMRDVDAVGDACGKFVFTSSYSNLFYDKVIPLFEYMYYGEVDVEQVSPEGILKETHLFDRFTAMEGTNLINNIGIIFYKYNNGVYDVYKRYNREYTVTNSYYTKSVDQYALKATQMYYSINVGDTVMKCFLFHPGLVKGLPRYQISIQLTKEVDSTFFEGIPIVKESVYIYTTLAGKPTRVIATDSKGHQIVTNQQFVKNNTSTSLYTIMNNRNLIDYPVLVIDSNITLNKELKRTVYEYKGWYNNLFINNHLLYTSLNGKALRLVKTVDSCDRYGNILQLRNEQNITNAFIYGIKGHYLFSEIVGGSYADLINATGLDTAKLNDPAVKDNEVITEINKIRNYYNNTPVIVSTITYDPLIGITSQIDENGNAEYFEYDALGRLVLHKDFNKDIIKKLCYNLLTLTSDCILNTDSVWINTDAPPTCQKDTNNLNTSYQLQEQIDLNPLSDTYKLKRLKVVGPNPAACPVPPPCYRYILEFPPGMNTNNLFVRYRPCGGSQVVSTPIDLDESGIFEICSETYPLFRNGTNGADYNHPSVTISISPNSCF